MLIGYIPGATRIMAKNQPEYQQLPILDHELGGTPIMTSMWTLSPEERLELVNGGMVFLDIVGTAHPPVMMRVGPMIVEKPPTEMERELGEALAAALHEAEAWGLKADGLDRALRTLERFRARSVVSPEEEMKMDQTEHPKVGAAKMHKYRSHKIIDAERIESIDLEMCWLHCTNSLSVFVGAEFIATKKPVKGGYFVVYNRGEPREYWSCSPADVFEEGYTRI